MPVSKNKRKKLTNSQRKKAMNTIKAYKKWIKSPRRINDPLLFPESGRRD
jgi:hypothetical protein